MPNCEDLEILRPKTKQDNSILEQFLGTKGQSASSCLYERKGWRSMPMKIAKQARQSQGRNLLSTKIRLEIRRQAKMPAPFLIEMT